MCVWGAKLHTVMLVNMKSSNEWQSSDQNIDFRRLNSNFAIRIHCTEAYVYCLFFLKNRRATSVSSGRTTVYISRKNELWFAVTFTNADNRRTFLRCQSAISKTCFSQIHDLHYPLTANKQQ